MDKKGYTVRELGVSNSLGDLIGLLDLGATLQKYKQHHTGGRRESYPPRGEVLRKPRVFCCCSPEWNRPSLPPGQGQRTRRGDDVGSKNRGTWRCTLGMIGDKSPLRVLRSPAVARRDRAQGRRTRDPLAGTRLPQSESDDDTTTEASGTDANIDAAPTVPAMTAAVLHEGDSWRRRRRPQGWRQASTYRVTIITG